MDEDEDDDYEPDFYAAEDTEQILNKLDSSPNRGDVGLEDGTRKQFEIMAEVADPSSLAPIGGFQLAVPPPLDPELAARASQVAASRLFGSLSGLDDGAATAASGTARKSRAGINRLAASSYDRDSWLTLITRLATRGTAGLEEMEEGTSRGQSHDVAGDSKALVAQALQAGGSSMPLGAAVREMLFHYVLEDFRRRIEVAVAWLCEEWYNDQLTKRRHGAGAASSGAGAGDPREASHPGEALHYETCALRLVDGILPFLSPQDKVLTRFLAEIPELSGVLLGRLKSLCSDPTKMQLALTSLLYLVIMKPPAREAALDAVAGIWTEYEYARPLAAKYLHKWRPGFIEAQTQRGVALAGE